MSEPKLYMIATPLGNKDDLTLRAKQVLDTLRRFFAEDTRELRKLLDLHGIGVEGKVLQSYSSHNMKEATEKAVRCLQEGDEVGFVCDRGTPAVSDPGAFLVSAVREAGFGVVPIPGPSAVTTLFSVAGFDSGRFSFVGFLPATLKERTKLFDLVELLGWPVCLYESPQRVRDTAQELKDRFPKGRLILGRELTKIFEQIEVVELGSLDPASLMEKGEYTLFLDVGPARQRLPEWESEVELRLATEKEWSKRVAERYGVASSEVYNALQQRKREQI